MSSKYLLLYFTFIVQLASAQKDEDAILVTGDQMPNFAYTNLEGTQTSISAEDGKCILLFFFATWCGPCREELAYVEKNLYPELKSNEKLSVFVFGREHTQEEVNTFKKAHNYQMTFLADPKRDIYSLFAKAYIPRCYFIDSNGTILFDTVGFNKDKMVKLQSLIKSTCN